MKKDLLYNDLLEAIKSRIPQKSKLANTLVNLLFIEKEAVYRRLRGDVPFTFAEIAIIAKSLGISLDNVVGSDISRSRPFQLKMINFEEPDEVDLMELERYVDILKMTRDDPSSVLAVAANSLPDKLYYSYKHLTKFFFLKGFTSLALMEVQKIIRIPGYRRIYLNYKGRRLLKLNILGQPIISSITSFSNTR